MTDENLFVKWDGSGHLNSLKGKRGNLNLPFYSYFFHPTNEIF